MKTHTLYREQCLPVPVTAAWDFFSSPANLSKITPPDMKFMVQSRLDDEAIHEGMKIRYKIRPLFNIPMEWITVIQSVNEPRSFTDAQLKGPYKLWEHTHTFLSIKGGVKMLDEVEYALPYGWLGDKMHGMIKKKLDHIFDFREVTLKKIFGEYKMQ